MPAAGLFVVCLAAGGSTHSAAVRGDGCRDLGHYTSQSYATEEGLERRCSLLREVETRGRLTPTSLRERLLEELSNRFAVELDFSGEVELSGWVVDYLLENMPETAALVSTYTDNEYRATQADETPGPASFFVTNTTSFAADFIYLSSLTTPSISRHMFFESGHARVLLWRVWGNSIVRYNLRKRGPDNARYDIRIHVFTDSRVLRTVLESGLFRYFADRMFRGILGDIETAVRRFTDDANPREHLPPYFVTGLNARLQRDDTPPPAR